MQRWFAIHTHPSCEAQAVRGIGEQGWRALNPLCSYERKRSRRIETITAPLFRRYVFAEFDQELDAWEAIAYTKGVVRILAHGGIPQAIPVGWVEDILANIEANGGAVPLEKPVIVPFVKGETVQFMDGPYTGFKALIELDEGARVRVLLDMFGSSRVIPVARESIARG